MIQEKDTASKESVLKARKKTIKESVATGRRKTAVASVRLRDGTGVILVNENKFEDYLAISPYNIIRETILSPINKVSSLDKYDLLIRVKGGGIEAQAIAIRLAIARALILEDASRKAALKVEGYLTRDPRMKERKKYGLRGARKRSQFSKR